MPESPSTAPVIYGAFISPLQALKHTVAARQKLALSMYATANQVFFYCGWHVGETGSWDGCTLYAFFAVPNIMLFLGEARKLNAPLLPLVPSPPLPASTKIEYDTAGSNSPDTHVTG